MVSQCKKGSDKRFSWSCYIIGWFPHINLCTARGHAWHYTSLLSDKVILTSTGEFRSSWAKTRLADYVRSRWNERLRAQVRVIDGGTWPITVHSDSDPPWSPWRNISLCANLIGMSKDDTRDVQTASSERTTVETVFESKTVSAPSTTTITLDDNEDPRKMPILKKYFIILVLFTSASTSCCIFSSLWS